MTKFLLAALLAFVLVAATVLSGVAALPAVLFLVALAGGAYLYAHTRRGSPRSPRK